MAPLPPLVFSLMGSWGSVLPSQPGPPVTSGCWSQFSTLPQAQSICWGFRHGGDFVKGEEGGEEKGEGKGGNQKWT